LLKRVKRRYLLLKVDSEVTPTDKELLNEIWVSIIKLYGEVGASQTGLSLVDYDAECKTGKLRVWLKSLQPVRASIASITRLAGKEAAVHVLAISGTLKSLREKK
jgi:RNase P/RNase MRP subunit POP5